MGLAIGQWPMADSREISRRRCSCWLTCCCAADGRCGGGIPGPCPASCPRVCLKKNPHSKKWCTGSSMGVPKAWIRVRRGDYFASSSRSPFPVLPSAASTPSSRLDSSMGNVSLLSCGTLIGGGSHHVQSITSYFSLKPESFSSATQPDFVETILLWSMYRPADSRSGLEI